LSPGGQLGRLGHYGALGAGIAGGGLSIAAMAQMSGLPALAGVAGVAVPMGLAGAGVVAGVGLGVEALNTFVPHFRQNPITPLGVWDSALKIGISQINAVEAGYNTWQYGGFALRSAFAPELAAYYDREMVQASWNRMSAGERAIMRRNVNDPELRRVQDLNSAWATYLRSDPAKTYAFTQAVESTYGQITPDTQERWSQAILRSGIEESALAQGAGQYASSFGFRMGTDDYREAFSRYMQIGDAAAYSRIDSSVGRASSLTSQALAAMSVHIPSSTSAALRSNFGFNTQGQAGMWAGAISAAQAGGAELSVEENMLLASAYSGLNPYVGGVLSGLGQLREQFGMDGFSTMVLGGYANLSGQDAFMVDRIASGDQRAASYWSWKSGGPWSWRATDPWGQPIQNTSGSGLYKYLLGNLSKLPGTQGVSFLSSQKFAQTLLGTSNPEIVQAFQDKGFMGLQRLSAQKSYEAQMAGVGVQLKGIALQEEFYWGAGSWDSPAAGSMWALEDQATARQRQSQAQDFTVAARRLEMSNQFAVKRENLTLQRMNVSNAYNLWQMDFNRTAALQQRGWTLQDWAYQDTVRGLNNQWGMEDINEAIRFSSGRERRQLVRQRERMAVSQNLEGEQVDRQRERQEETWRAEDERYEKYRAYILELQELDRENFEQSRQWREENYALDRTEAARKRKEWEEQTQLEDEMRALQRQFQHNQLQLQREAAGIQAAAAAAQKEIADALANAEPKVDNFTTKLGEINTYEKSEAIMKATAAMLQMANGLDTQKLASAQKLFDKMAGIDPVKVQQLIWLLDRMLRPLQ
ncbi:MAG TPA: hypothetical protein VFF68_10760, partial [Anaerolineaceae bacterium]|nr:hypothetical protein [Anaerolineaceae bacterium]